MPLMVAVGALITERPPQRSRRALLTHRAHLRTRLSRGYRCAGNPDQHRVGFLKSFDVLTVIVHHGVIQRVDASETFRVPRCSLVLAISEGDLKLDAHILRQPWKGGRQ